MFNFLPSPSLERTVNNWHYQVAFGKSCEQSAHLLHPQECIASLPNWISHSSSSFSITLLSYHLGKKKNTGFLRLIVRVNPPTPPHLTVRGVTGLGLSPKEYQSFFAPSLKRLYSHIEFIWEQQKYWFSRHSNINCSEITKLKMLWHWQIETFWITIYPRQSNNTSSDQHSSFTHYYAITLPSFVL